MDLFLTAENSGNSVGCVLFLIVVGIYAIGYMHGKKNGRVIGFMNASKKYSKGNSPAISSGNPDDE